MINPKDGNCKLQLKKNIVTYKYMGEEDVLNYMCVCICIYAYMCVMSC